MSDTRYVHEKKKKMNIEEQQAVSLNDNAETLDRIRQILVLSHCDSPTYFAIKKPILILSSVLFNYKHFFLIYEMYHAKWKIPQCEATT